MRTDLKQRLRRCIGFAQRSLGIAFNVAIVLILMLAALLVAVAWYAYKPAIVFVGVVTVIAIGYLKIRYDEMTGSIRSINIEERDAEIDRQRLSDQVVHKVVDTLTNLALASIEDTIRLASAAIALIGAFICLLGSGAVGVFIIFLSALLFSFSCCCFNYVRYLVTRAVKSFLSTSIRANQNPQPNDQCTPLVHGDNG